MELKFENVEVFIKFLKFFMNLSRKKQLEIIKNVEKELKSKCSK